MLLTKEGVLEGNGSSIEEKCANLKRQIKMMGILIWHKKMEGKFWEKKRIELKNKWSHCLRQKCRLLIDSLFLSNTIIEVKEATSAICRVCFSTEIRTLHEPCHHFFACKGCSKKLKHCVCGGLVQARTRTILP